MISEYQSAAFRENFGLMHVYTMTNVVTGLKPLQNIVNLLVFAFNRSTHLRLLTVMAQLDRSFRLHFNTESNYERGIELDYCFPF